MRKIKIRNDLISKQEYHKRYGVSRPRINEMIKNGELTVERISNIDYIRI